MLTLVEGLTHSDPVAPYHFKLTRLSLLTSVLIVTAKDVQVSDIIFDHTALSSFLNQVVKLIEVSAITSSMQPTSVAVVVHGRNSVQLSVFADYE